jgi:hypothetical protein
VVSAPPKNEAATIANTRDLLQPGDFSDLREENTLFPSAVPRDIQGKKNFTGDSILQEESRRCQGIDTLFTAFLNLKVKRICLLFKAPIRQQIFLKHQSAPSQGLPSARHLLG